MPDGPTKPRAQAAWWLPMLLALALAASAAMMLPGNPPWARGAALLLLLAAAATGGAAWARQRLQPSLRDARLQLHALTQLAGTWVWQTDAQHRLLRLQPPPGATPADWSLAAVNRNCLWTLLDDAEQSLQGRMQAQALLVDLPVRPVCQRTGDSAAGSGGTSPSIDEADASNALPWRLRALPWHDASGRFAGYHGVAEAPRASAMAPVSEPLAKPGAAAPVATGSAPTTAPAAAADTHPANPAMPQAQATASLSTADADAAAQRALAEEHASFSYTVSHDLRAPIRVVEGFARILKEDYGPKLDRVGNDHLDRVMSAAARMNHMIDALLSLSRLSTEPLSRRPVDLSQLAQWVIDDLKRAQPERAVVVTIAPGLVANGDPTLLRMLLDNLLGNAWKYSAKVAQAEIRFQRALQGGRDVLVVQDNGAGFDMRFAERLFGVFQRLHSSSDFAGHGVGLASVRRIVRRHGGEIWADSEVGRGARFYFTLPG